MKNDLVKKKSCCLLLKVKKLIKVQKNVMYLETFTGPTNTDE